ncbi:TerB family tellurite resistance protein [Cereibacter sphaeroides]|uniref:YcjF family protein n=1 Tax=Cereibacter sphaeroides TaxID=1063 RepID=UPI0039907B08
MPEIAPTASDLDFEGAHQVIAEPLRLKHKLAIGEDAYASMRMIRSASDLAVAGGSAAAGGAIAASSTVAGTFFGGGLLPALGFGTAVTPVGWVVGAAMVTGGVALGVTRLWRTYERSRVHAIPAFINTPLDVLGMSLFDLMAGLALKLCEAGDGIDDTERAIIREIFVKEWGFDPDYVAHALPVVEDAVAGRTLEDLARSLAQFQRDNPDCNAQAMHADLILFLTEVAEADGRIEKGEASAIARVNAIFRDANRGLLSRAGSLISGWTFRDRAVAGDPAESSYLNAVVDLARSGESEKLVKTATVPALTLWLLGRTGAGKSSLVQALTGASAAQVGNGFTSCTRTAVAYDHPVETPVLRFLDTRGLAEVGYDPAEDLAACEKGSHAILAIARLDDPVQGELAEVLATIRRRRPDIPILVIHTGADLVEDAEARARARATTQARLEAAVGEPLPSVETALSPSTLQDAPPADLVEALSKILPEIALILMDEDAKDAEGRAFSRNRAMVLWFAAAAAATDAAPVVGLVTVPGLQGALLHRLAAAYGVEWTKARMAGFAAALGTSIVLRAGVELLLRQAVKLVPAYGQTVGAASAATISFSTTLALGRAAAAWLHHEARGEPMSPADLQQRYRDALGRAMLARS